MLIKKFSPLQLIENVISIVEKNDKKKVAIISGHYPLVYNAEGHLIEGVDAWGQYTLSTWAYGARLVSKILAMNKTPQVYLIADDKSATVQTFSKYKFSSTSKLSRQRHKYYKQYNKSLGLFPAAFAKHAELLPYIVRHNHGKKGRENTLMFAETILERDYKGEVENSCAKAYMSLLTQHVDLSNTFVISFIPMRCYDNICNIALFELEVDLHGVHVFLPAMSGCSEEEMLSYVIVKEQHGL